MPNAYIRMIQADYPHEVGLPEYDMTLEARADAWLHMNAVDYMDYFQEVGDLRVYCFREASWATMFKLSFYGLNSSENP